MVTISPDRIVTRTVSPSPTDNSVTEPETSQARGISGDQQQQCSVSLQSCGWYSPLNAAQPLKGKTQNSLR